MRLINSSKNKLNSKISWQKISQSNTTLDPNKKNIYLLLCWLLKTKKGDQPLEKGIQSGKREKEGLYYLFMHA